jgi:nitrite reductase/ring-hydroxylating ferredoxin subunit
VSGAISARPDTTGPSAVAYWPSSVAGLIGAYQARLELQTRGSRPAEFSWATLAHPPTTPSDPGNRPAPQPAVPRAAVFRVGDVFYAVDDVCPHRTGPLSEGTLEFTRRGVLVTCPFHGWQFDLATGACATSRGRFVRTWPVRADASGVRVLLPDAPGAPDPPDAPAPR